MTENIKLYGDVAERETSTGAGDWTEALFVKSLHVYCQLVADKIYVKKLRKRVATLATHYGVSKEKLFLKCILDHLPILETELAGKLSHDTEYWQTVAILRERERIEREADYREDHQKIYNDLGPERYESWCTKHGFDPQKLLDSFIDVNSIVSESVRVRTWLENYLRNGPVSVELIKDALKNAEILTPDEQNWDKIRMIAQREGYTRGGKRGEWQLS